jgi:SAM-dependent methyltransferase
MKVKGRESPQSYSEAQYGWAKSGFKLHAPYVNLQDKVVLDAGCGPGGKTVFYAEMGCKRIVGIDIDENRLGYAREFAKKKNALNAEFVLGSLVSLPFDYIFMNDVVEHIERPILVKALEECRRVVKPGGKICLEFPPWSSFDAAHLYDYIYLPWCQVLFSPETLVGVMNRLKPAHPVIGNLSVVEHFLELNRITISESKELFKKLNFKIIAFDLNMLLDMKFVKYIPILRKYWTRRVVAVLGK